MKPETEKLPVREITHWKAKPFIVLTAGFFAFMALMFVALGHLTASWTHHTWPPDGPTPSAQSTAGWNNSAPQLQPDALADWQHWQQHEQQQLHRVQWTDNSHVYATIPIERAMAMVAAADSGHRLDQVLPPAKPATPLELQNQKSAEAPKSP